MERGKRKKNFLFAGLSVLAAGIAAGGVVFFLIKKDEGEKTAGISRPEFIGENMISASGLTAAGMAEEEYGLDFLETKLYVEESYLSAGDSVEAGTKVFRVSDESLTEAREELERAAKEAELDYRQGTIDYETGKLEAENTWKLSQINEEYAQAEYDSAVNEAREKVTELEKQVEEAEALYEEYRDVVENNRYYTEYRVEELQNTWQDNFSFLMELYEKWDIEGLYDKYPNRGSGSGDVKESVSSGVQSKGQSTAAESLNDGDQSAGEESMSGTQDAAGQESRSQEGGAKDAAGQDDGTQDEVGQESGSHGSGTQDETEQDGGSRNGSAGQSGGQGNALGGNDESGKLTVYEMMEELVTKNGEEYEAAAENYEKDTLLATASLDQAKSNLTTLKAKLEEAKLALEKQTIKAKADYDTVLAENGSAQSVYETTLQKLKEEYEALKDEKENTEENLALFEETIGDGYYYTESAGTVVMNRVRAGSYLSSEGGVLFAYSDPETITVAAGVDQSDIAQITLGDSACVVINGYGSFEGIVRSIDPSVSSESRSSVTYTVNVELTGDTGSLESNLTAAVYFGLTQEQIEQMERMSGRTGSPEEKGNEEKDSVSGNMPGGKER